MHDLPVQERERGFSQHDECCVPQLQHLRESECPAPDCIPGRGQSCTVATTIHQAIHLDVSGEREREREKGGGVDNA